MDNTSTTLKISIADATNSNGPHVHTYIVAVHWAVWEEGEDTVSKGVRWMGAGSHEIKGSVNKHK